MARRSSYAPEKTSAERSRLAKSHPRPKLERERGLLYDVGKRVAPVPLEDAIATLRDLVRETEDGYARRVRMCGDAVAIPCGARLAALQTAVELLEGQR